MNKPTPETDAAIEEVSHYDHDGEYRPYKRVSIDFARSLELKLQEAERQRDEERVEHGRWAGIAADAMTERDQLIKVVDELATSLQEAADTYDEEGFNNANFLMALTAYSFLPHVQAKKGKE